jgi:hypothetical protein
MIKVKRSQTFDAADKNKMLRDENLNRNAKMSCVNFFSCSITFSIARSKNESPREKVQTARNSQHAKKRAKTVHERFFMKNSPFWSKTSKTAVFMKNVEKHEKTLIESQKTEVPGRFLTFFSVF